MAHSNLTILRTVTDSDRVRGLAALFLAALAAAAGLSVLSGSTVPLVLRILLVLPGAAFPHRFQHSPRER